MLHEFAFNSEEEHKEGRGRFHEFAVDTEEMQAAWVDALPPPRQFTVQGYLHKRRVGARKLGGDFDMRYAVYDVISGFFAYYENEQEAKLDMKPRGAARVVSAVLRPTAKIPHLFSFFSDDGKEYASPPSQMWLSLPRSNGHMAVVRVSQLSTLRRGLN